MQAILEHLSHEPVGSEGVIDIMKGMLDYLFNVPAAPSDGVHHWFCQRANSVTRDAATFLIRPFVYDSQQVVDWRVRIITLLTSCCDCVRGLQEAKRTSQELCVHLLV